MKKLMNQVDQVLIESLRGFGEAHKDILQVSLNPLSVVRKHKKSAEKVALISGGGSGHEPMHAGFVGKGMLDAACPGQVFTSPTPDQILHATEAVGSEAGVLFIVKNYSGDVMNFEMAAEMYAKPSAQIITTDDVAVEDSLHSQGRRGVAATVILEKIVGALAEEGANLQDCLQLAEHINQSSASLGVALSSGTVPAVGKPTFTLNEHEIEFGVGIHGEPGRRRAKLDSANVIAENMLNVILEDLKPSSKDSLLLLVNGLGSSTLLELYGMFDSASSILKRQGLSIARSLVGNYCTSLEMAGCSFSLVKLNAQMLSLWDKPVHTVAMRWG